MPIFQRNREIMIVENEDNEKMFVDTIVTRFLGITMSVRIYTNSVPENIKGLIEDEYRALGFGKK